MNVEKKVLKVCERDNGDFFIGKFKKVEDGKYYLSDACRIKAEELSNVQEDIKQSFLIRLYKEKEKEPELNVNLSQLKKADTISY